jgi:4-hydroxy-3-methylbut-2-enyl diphosphate reductase
VAAYLIDQAEEMKPEWFSDASMVGLTAGASAPEYLVEEVITTLKNRFQATSEEVFVREENVVFSLPKELSPLNAR